MKQVEITYRANMAELEKLNAKLEKAEKAYSKKLAAAQKAGVAEWDDEQHREWMQGIEKTECGFIKNEEDVKKNGAWFDMMMAEDRVAEAKEKIQRAEAKFEKAEEAVNAYHEELERMADLKMKEELWKFEFEEEQREWAKDGITLTGRYTGMTPQGKRFWIYGNHGFTRRSLHCFTLTIDTETIFTSGEFWRAYSVIKNS